MVHRYLVVGLCLPLLACASGGGGSTGTAGTTGSTGTAGATGAAGTTGGAAGTTGAIPGLGMGGPFTFPQNKVSGSCTLTTVANAASATTAAYSNWKSTYVVAGNPGSRVQRPENGNDTVSEGMGYGMLAAVYMADKTTFDALLTYVQAHLDSKGLMSFCIPNGGGSCSGSGSATDGDEDIIWALLMASDQWNSTSYLSTAQTMITAMRAYSLFSDGTLQNGDNYNTADMLNPDYFSPAYYRVFAKATGDPFWSTYVIDSNYQHLAAVDGNDGLVPDSTNLESSLTCTSCVAKYAYDACRTPWRITMDYCFNGEPRALAYIQKIAPYFSGIGAANIGDGYTSPNGPATSNNHNSAFIGPAGVSGMGGYQTLLDGAFTFNVTNPSGNAAYFPQSLRVLSMLMMSGNFLDYTHQ